ncbi:hypothetical protein ACVH9Z_34315 [Rhodococcus opacus]|uniref:hypothetical protein n=1 Tax=Rhodococcus opacus TaxID=37919 RepID=UPI001B3086EB|nr:hypothetical protein [Rhodococcus opacus]
MNGIGSIPLAVLGFGLAIWQAYEARRAANRAETAADAAKRAAEESRGQFRLLSAASLLPQLNRLEETIDQAVDKQSLELLLHAVSSWRWQAGMCRGYLDPAREEEAAVMVNIQKSMLALSQLKQSILDFGDSTDWAKETKRARKAIGDVTGELGALAAYQSVKE